MIKNAVIIFLFLNCFCKAFSQNFEGMPYIENGMFADEVERIFYDSIHNKLICSSKYINYAGGKKVRGIFSWNGIVWDSLSSGINTHIMSTLPHGTVFSGISYEGKLLVGGAFESIGGVKATKLATWNGIKWDSLPIRAFNFVNNGGVVYGFCKYKGSLYIHGNFDTIQGKKANGLAIYDGVSFNPILLPIQEQATIIDMKIYNGELYVGGVFSFTGELGNNHILKFNGISWENVKGGIKGNTSSNASMVVYNNELYVGGYFLKDAGNVANIIMKWDGTTWKDVGWGNEYMNAGIWKLLVHHDKLYAFGTFILAANSKASKVAVFDGSKWCTYADSLNESIFSAAIYNDEIYVAGAFSNISGDTSKKLIAKIKHPEIYNKCVTVFENNTPTIDTELSIYPNPTNSILYIETTAFNTQDATIIIINTLGQLIFSQNYTSQIDISSLASDIYFLTIKDKYNSKTVKIIKQ